MNLLEEKFLEHLKLNLNFSNYTLIAYKHDINVFFDFVNEKVKWKHLGKNIDVIVKK